MLSLLPSFYAPGLVPETTAGSLISLSLCLECPSPLSQVNSCSLPASTPLLRKFPTLTLPLCRSRSPWHQRPFGHSPSHSWSFTFIWKSLIKVLSKHTRVHEGRLCALFLGEHQAPDPRVAGQVFMEWMNEWIVLLWSYSLHCASPTASSHHHIQHLCTSVPLLTLSLSSVSSLCVPEPILPSSQLMCYKEWPWVIAWPPLHGAHSALGAQFDPSLLTKHLLRREMSAEYSWLMFNCKNQLFFTINIFHEILSEACELTLGEQCGSRMVKVDSSWKKTQNKAVAIFQWFSTCFT